jgi:shikimate dehydrogenase
MTDKYAEPLNGIDRYAVVGNPISHSKSPLIHEAFAKQTNQDISYERILAPLDGFEATVRDLIAQGYKGANVTVPFKSEAHSISNSLSEYAKAAGAVNTLIFDANRIIGDNTDGIGLVNDLQHNLSTKLDDKRILLLGAGGAARGAVLSLLLANPAEIVIANRNASKAQEMVSEICKSEVLKNTSIPLGATSYEFLNGQVFDIVINATSAGLTDTALPIPNSIFAKNCLAYDMMYGRETPFMKQARKNGANVSDGLGMLVEQAAHSFFLWRHVNPETQSVIQQIRNMA